MLIETLLRVLQIHVMFVCGREGSRCSKRLRVGIHQRRRLWVLIEGKGAGSELLPLDVDSLVGDGLVIPV
jgi:hypothetical protein